jgi:tRNA nucleotidyltransferase/poly(A) polymerase
MIALTADTIRIMEALANNGFKVYAVGGCVRDALLGKEPMDWDLATDARLWNLIEIFPEAKVISEKYSVLRKDFPPYRHVDIATFRTEAGYSDSRRPDQVEFVDTIFEDLKRRDFTINAIAYSFSGLLVDPYNGEKDLLNKTIRCVGDPMVRFSENPIRMLRAARLAAEYGFSVDDKIFDAMSRLGGLLQKAGPDRIRTDFLRLISGPDAAKGLKLILETPMMDAICGIPPEALPALVLVKLDELCQTIDATSGDTEARLALFYKCFGPEHGPIAIAAMHFDKKTRKRLEAAL